MIAAAKNLNNLRTTNAAAQTLPPLRAESAHPNVAAGPLTSYGELDKQAHNLIGTTFYATLLKQMHDSPFKSELFSGGRGGEAFGGMYDQVLSQRMAQRGGDRMVRPIVKKFKAAAEAAYERQNRKTTDTFKQESQHVPHDRRA